MSSYFLGILASLTVFFVIVDMLRRRRLRERHAVWWLLASLVSFILSLFPVFLVQISAFIGFEVPSNLIFFLSIIVLFLVFLQQSAELTRLEENQRIFAEEIAGIKYKLDSE